VPKRHWPWKVRGSSPSAWANGDLWIVTIDESGWHTEDSGRRLPVDNRELTFTGEAGLVRFDFVFIALHDHIGKGLIQGFLDLQILLLTGA